jgi:hypothetical protein
LGLRVQEQQSKGIKTMSQKDKIRSMSRVKYYVLMYESGKKWDLVENISRMRKGEKRMMEEVNSVVIYCKKLCKCHNVPLVQQ